ncbi:hypothetical protein JCM10212_005064 [Sporobolomyces blumeae]
MRIEEGFQQTPLQLPLAYTDDHALRSLLERVLPSNVFQATEDDLKRFEKRLAGPIRDLASQADVSPHSVEPILTQYDQWGRRVDKLETSHAWEELKKVAIEEGIVATAVERLDGEFSRVKSFAKTYLFAPDGLYVGCPMSMTDGAARVVELAGTDEMKRDVLPRLCSRDPKEAWIAGQWMTERTGGSDVSLTETTARPLDPSQPARPGDAFVIDGFKWFSSATDGDIALALARTGDDKSGSRGLSLFLIPLRNEDGTTNGIYVHRLKKKFGTKALPTAELSLSGCRGQLVGELGAGVRTISTVLNITRLYSALSCTAALRRCLDLAEAFARVRHIGGDHSRLLRDDAMHTDALARSELVHRALLHLDFGVAHLIGRSETHGAALAEEEKWRLRLLTPVVKTFSAELSTSEMPRVMEAVGGQGYMQENQFGRMIQDANVERIWEGTTSVLALDVVRVILQSNNGAVEALIEWSRSVFNRAAVIPGLAASVETLVRRYDLLRTISSRFVARSADPRMTRPQLFLIGHIASATYLAEQAIWSHAERRQEARLDAWVVERWVAQSDAKETEFVLEELLAQDQPHARATLKMERALVHGRGRGSKL